MQPMRATFLHGPRQGLLQPHRAQRARLHRDAGARRPGATARVAVADGPEGDYRPAADFVRIAHDIGVKEVYLQRLVFFERAPVGMARPDQALFERLSGDETQHLAAAEAQAAALGISFNASGATEPGESLARKAEKNPWSLCRRPWSVMYFTANGRALPCCIAPFSQKGYENYTLGDATQQTLREIWNGPGIPRSFRAALQSDAPPQAPAPAAACAGACSRWRRPASESRPIMRAYRVIIPCLTRRRPIGAVRARQCWRTVSAR